MNSENKLKIFVATPRINLGTSWKIFLIKVDEFILIKIYIVFLNIFQLIKESFFLIGVVIFAYKKYLKN